MYNANLERKANKMLDNPDTPETSTLLMAVGLAVVLVLGFALNPTPAFAGQCKGKNKDDPGCGEPPPPAEFAMVTIDGPITSGSHSFGLDKNTINTLELNSWTGIERGAAVPMSYNFLETETKDCECMRGKKWDQDKSSKCEDYPIESKIDIRGHLNGTMMDRWSAVIRIDTSELQEVGASSTTSSQGGHSIDFWTDPTVVGASTVSNTVEVMWIPEGPSKSGEITVKYVGIDGNGVRTFDFQPVDHPSMIHVWTDSEKGKRTFMRCPTSETITVTVAPATGG
jgi:hypothetical protein